MASYDPSKMFNTPTIAPVSPKAVEANQQAQAAQVAAPLQGPTGFWGRISQIGIGKVNALSAYRTVVEHEMPVQSNNAPLKDAGRATNAAGRFLLKGTAKLANQAYQEGKQVVDITKMEVANATHNPEAFFNANKQSQKDYEGFNKDKGGLFNAGTATSSKEAKQGDLKSGVKGIGGAILETAGELIPLAKFSEGAKVYKLGEGLVGASHGAMRQITENTVLGLISGATGTTGADLLSTGKINLKSTFKGAAAGGILGGGTTAIAKGIGILGTIFREGPTAALDKLKGGSKASGAMTDVLDNETANKLAAPVKIPVSGGDEATKVGVKTPLRPGVKEVSQTDKVVVKTPVMMSATEYTKKFNDLSKSYDKAYRDMEKMSPAEQKIRGNVVDTQHVKALEQLNQDYIHGVVPETPSKVTKLTSATSKAGKTTGGTPKLDTTPIKEAPVSTGTGKTTLKATPKTEDLPSSKVSTSALKSEQRAVQAGLVKEFENKASYSTTSYAEDTESAVKLAHDDPNKALDIATGKVSGNNPSHEVAVRIAVENKATQEGDSNILRQLGMSQLHGQTSEAAQRLGAEAYNANPDSAVAAIQHIAATRAEVAGKRLGTDINKAVTSTIKDADSHIKVPSKSEWTMFLESVKC